MDFSVGLFLLSVFTLCTEFAYAAKDLCKTKCRFPRSCHQTSYIQVSSCAYACICDGDRTDHVEENFSTCGTGKRCYSGDCLTEVPKLCQQNYGYNYIGLLNEYNTCVYQCMNKYSPCNLYQEDFRNGIQCFTNRYTVGKCFRGRCACGYRRPGPGPPVKRDLAQQRWQEEVEMQWQLQQQHLRQRQKEVEMQLLQHQQRQEEMEMQWQLQQEQEEMEMQWQLQQQQEEEEEEEE